MVDERVLIVLSAVATAKVAPSPGSNPSPTNNHTNTNETGWAKQKAWE